MNREDYSDPNRKQPLVMRLAAIGRAVFDIIKVTIHFVVVGSKGNLLLTESSNVMDFVECDTRLCPSRAIMYFTKEMLSLAFCSHHAHQYKSRLEAEDWEELEIAPNNETISRS